MNKNLSYSMAMLALGAGIASCSQQNEDVQKPNILFIMSDDHTQQAISAYGYDLLHTPNIDRLAKEGAIFKQSFVTNSICAPSRAVMLTGKYSHLNGKPDNHGDFNWDQQNFAKLLQQAGYQTSLVGKIHLNGLPQGFDYSIVLPGQGLYYNPVFIENGERKEFEGHTTPLTTEFALNWLENIRDKEKPFVLVYNQKAPHRNWLPETQYLDFLEDREFDFPENFFDDYEGRGSAAKEQEMELIEHMYWGHDMKLETNPLTGEPNRFTRNINQMNDEQRDAWRSVYDPINKSFLEKIPEDRYEFIFQEPPRPISHDYLKNTPEGRELASFMFHRYLRDYLKTIKSIDDGVGEILDYLEKNGLLENTIVIYTSDQGFYLGEHGWFDKRFMYEQSLSTPLLMRYPKEIEPGTEVDELVLNLDLAPTFLDYAGLEKPNDMQGESFRELAAGKQIEDWRDAIYYHYYEYPSVHMVKRHYGVRTDRYKLIHFYYDIDEWEMYDLQEDPKEMNSVYDDTTYMQIRTMLHKKLDELRLKYGDSDELSQQFLEEYLEDRN